MIRIEMFPVETTKICYSNTPNAKRKELAPIEEFIAKIGYENIKNIIVSQSGGSNVYYSVFYEDGQPYTPYVEDEPKKKGLFG